jgi:hypothetical protein
MTEQTLPDYVLDPSAVLNDTAASWRYGRIPDYTKTREFYEKSPSAFSLPPSPLTKDLNM